METDAKEPDIKLDEADHTKEPGLKHDDKVDDKKESDVKSDEVDKKSDVKSENKQEVELNLDEADG